jgi:hypothetical protein
MPIYDWNGTSGNQIGKIYDWDGTSNNQIGKIYDWDGSANNLIYSSELNGLTEAAWVTSNGTYGGVNLSSSQIYVYVDYGSDKYRCAYFPFNASDYNKITVTYTTTGHYNTLQIFGVSTDTTFSKFASSATVSNGSHSSGGGWVIYENPTSSGKTVTGTKELDISSLTGTYYFKVGVWHASSADVGRITLTKILFE